MDTYADILIRRNRRSGLLVDTNVMLLLLVGRLGVEEIGRFRATRRYDASAFGLASKVFTQFTQIHTTAQVVTELDNLSRQISRDRWVRVAGEARAMVEEASEARYPSATLMAHALYPSLGVTDCSILELVRERPALVLTDDLALTSVLERSRRDVINLSRLLH